jgi:hypothetical protein
MKKFRMLWIMLVSLKRNTWDDYPSNKNVTNNKPTQEIVENMKTAGCKQITFHTDPATSISAVFVIESFVDKRNKQGKLKLTSIVGGTRFVHHDMDIALQDTLKLAMSRKATILRVKEQQFQLVKNFNYAFFSVYFYFHTILQNFSCYFCTHNTWLLHFTSYNCCMTQHPSSIRDETS